MGQKIVIVGMIVVGVMAVLTAFVVAVVILVDSSDRQQAALGDQSDVSTAPSSVDYPLDWCLVSGEDLSCKAEPVSDEYHGQMFKFCCGQCLIAFRHDPGFYLDRLGSLGRRDTGIEAARMRALDRGKGLQDW